MRAILLLGRKPVLDIDRIALLPIRGYLPRGTEVDQCQRAVRLKDDVVRADIPVQQPLRMYARQ